MVDSQTLAGIIVSRGKTQKDVAHHLDMAPKTFYSKMKKGVFGSDEIESMIDYLELEMSVAVPVFLRRKSLDR